MTTSVSLSFRLRRVNAIITSYAPIGCRDLARSLRYVLKSFFLPRSQCDLSSTQLCEAVSRLISSQVLFDGMLMSLAAGKTKCRSDRNALQVLRHSGTSHYHKPRICIYLKITDLAMSVSRDLMQTQHTHSHWGSQLIISPKLTNGMDGKAIGCAPSQSVGSLPCSARFSQNRPKPNPLCFSSLVLTLVLTASLRSYTNLCSHRLFSFIYAPQSSIIRPHY